MLEVVILVAAALVAWSVFAGARTVARAVEGSADQLDHTLHWHAAGVDAHLIGVKHAILEAAPFDPRKQPADATPPALSERDQQFGKALAWLSSSRMDPARAEESRLALERVFGLREDEIDEATAVELLHRHGVPEELWRG
jgi:hypothetical protein